MVSLLGIDFGEGVAYTRALHPSAGGPVWVIGTRKGVFNKLDIGEQRTKLLAELLRRFPKSVLRWKGAPPEGGDLGEFINRAPVTWGIPHKAPADRLRMILTPGEWVIYATPSGNHIVDDRLDIWDDRQRFWALSSVPDFFLGSRAGDGEWRFWIRPGLGG